MTTVYTKSQFLKDARNGMMLRPVKKCQVRDGRIVLEPWQPVVKVSSKRIESVVKDPYSGRWMHPGFDVPDASLVDYREDDTGKLLLIYEPGYRLLKPAEKKALAAVEEMTEAEAKEYLHSRKMTYLLGIKSNGKQLSTEPNTYQFVLDNKVKGNLRSAYRIKLK